MKKINRPAPHLLLRHRFSAVMIIFVVFVLTFSLMPLVFASPVPAPKDQVSPAIEITTMAPEILTSHSDLGLEATVNPIPEYMRGVPEDYVLEVFVQGHTPANANEIDQYLRGGQHEGWLVGHEVLSLSQGQQLSAGRGTTVSINCPEWAMPFWSDADWGPRGVTLRLSSQTGAVEGRSLVVWESTATVSPTHANVFVGTQVQSSTVPLLESLSSRDGVTIAADADLLYQDTDVFEGLVAQAQSEPDLTTLFQSTVLPVAKEIVVLPSQEADLSLLAASGERALSNLAAESRTVVSPAPTSATLLPNLVVGDPQWFGKQTADAYPEDILLSPVGTLTPQVDPGKVPTSRVEISAEAGETVVFPVESPEEAITQTQTVTLITAWDEASTLLDTVPTTSAEALILRQQLRALGALNSIQSGGESQFFSARTTADDPGVAERIDALINNSWTLPASLSEVSSSHPSSIPRETLLPRVDDDLTTLVNQFGELGSAYAGAVAFALATPDSRELADSFTQTILGTARANLNSLQREESVQRVVKELRTFSDAIEIVPSSAVNVINRNVMFPATLFNSSEYPVSVSLALKSSDAILQTTKTVGTVVPPNGTVTAEIPVIAVGSGDVKVHIVATTPSGVVLDTSAEVTVRVRPNWEDTGTITVMSAVALLFVLGMIRTIRRGLRGRRERLRAPGSTALHRETKENQE